jgi:hypothetical protein
MSGHSSAPRETAGQYAASLAACAVVLVTVLCLLPGGVRRVSFKPGPGTVAGPHAGQLASAAASATGARAVTLAE